MVLGLLVALALQLPSVSEAAPPSPRLLEAAAPLAALPHTRLTGYSVSGTSLRSLRSTMSGSGPTDSAGARHHALTKWRLQPRLMRRNGECDASTAELEYAITVTLPDLETKDRFSRAERETWDRYFTALVAHEMNHARIVQAGAERVRAAMRAAVGCEAILAASRAAIAEIGDASRQYDQQTQHGRTEGAWL